nr:hypothetical protein [Tanacetum cinerariifolium]
MVEHASSSSESNPEGKGKNDKKSKGKAEYLAPKVIPRQPNLESDNVDMIAMMSDIIAMISEVNLVERLTMERSFTWKLCNC